jgi:hypothetical protein
MTLDSPSPQSPLPLQRIFRTWWPLAASWLLMGVELPALSAVVARLPNPEINLAAYGGVVFPIALIVESPIIMLLAASTALSKDWSSYRKLHRVMITAGIGLTTLHLLVAFTPIYYVVVNHILAVPAEIVEPAHLGLKIMTPWTWSIAYRRFNQGVLIRFEHTKAISLGTMIRLTTDVVVLLGGYFIGKYPGILVATSAVAAGVITEALFIGVVVRPVVRNQVRLAPPVKQTLTLKGFLDFYIPLAMTSLLFLLVQPLGSAALSRMPQALASLAIWPVVTGLIFMLRSLGMAYNEVVVALLDEPLSLVNLRRFTNLLTGITTILLLIVAITPLSGLWFSVIQGLKPDLSEIAQVGLWIAVPIPGLNVLQSWYQGTLVNGRRTRGVTEAVVVFLLTSLAVLGVGVGFGTVTGLYIAMTAFSLSMLTQSAWLWFRSRPVFHAVQQRDAQASAWQPSEATLN